MDRHPSEMTPAELRCLRESLGLTIRSLGKAIGQNERTVARWELDEQPISRKSAALLAGLIAFTDETIEDLVAAHESESTIVTYLDDEDVEVSEWDLSAQWHRAVAWRAAQRIPGARVDYSG